MAYGLKYTLSSDGLSYSVTGYFNITATDEVVIPSTYNDLPVTSIGDWAFGNCSSLTSIIIGNNVTSIGECAFKGCKSLKNVNIPNSVETIKGSAFHSCESLTSITIPDSVNYIGWYLFERCINLTSVTLSDSITRLSGHMFKDCVNLKSIIIPDSVTRIEDLAFSNCRSLETIALLRKKPPTLTSTNAIPSTTTIYVPQSAKEAYKAASNWAAFAGKIDSNNTYLSLIRFNKKNKEYIQEQIDNIYQARQGSLTSIPIANTFSTEIITIPCIPYNAFGEATDIETYCKNLLKWLCVNYPNKENITFIGQMQPNSIGFGMVHIYNTSELNNEGYPRYSSGMYIGLQTTLRLFGTMEYTFTYKEI